MRPTSKPLEREGVVSRTGQAADFARCQLVAAGLKPTKPRIALAQMLFAEGHRHVTAEDLHAEAMSRRRMMSLATVYNTMNAFARVGLLRSIQGVGGRTIFDTNTVMHHHFHVEGSDLVLDVPDGALCFARMPEPPAGMRVLDVQVIVRVAPSEEA